MTGKMILEVACPSRTGASLAALFQQVSTTGNHNGLATLSELFAAFSGGLYPACVRMSTDDSTPIAATITIACTQSGIVAGDQVWFVVNGTIYTLTAVTSGTPVNGDGTFAAITSNTVMGANLATAINTLPGLSGVVSAVNGSGTVTVTALVLGAQPNNWTAKSKASGGAMTVGNSGAFSGGIDGGADKTATWALSGAMSDADTITIGSVVLTGKTSPSGESQFAVGVSAAADGAAMAACINAHSKLKGLVLATGTSTVTTTFQIAGRLGALVTNAKSSSAITLTGASYAPSTTDAWASSVQEFRIGIASP